MGHGTTCLFCISPNSFVGLLRAEWIHFTECGLDLKAQPVDALVSLSPLSALGLFWLQAHFPVEEWDVLLGGQAAFSAECFEAIVSDARAAGLSVEMPAQVRS